MHKEVTRTGKRSSVVDWKPTVPTRVKPRIVGEETRKGVLLYIDQDGGRHEAQAFDRAWGKINPGAIQPKRKETVSRIFKR